MANTDLIVFSVLILLAAYGIDNEVTPQERTQLELGFEACNFNYYGLPVGELGQGLSPDLAERCEEIKQQRSLLNLIDPAYMLGFILLVVGLFTGGGQTVIIREVVKDSRGEVVQGGKKSKWQEFQTTDIEKFKILRSKTNRHLAGVCGGIGEAFGWSKNQIDILRIVFIFLVFVNGFGIVLYALLWLILPEEK